MPRTSIAHRPWYEVLEIGPAASAEEIRSAYLALVRAWHPDRFASVPEMAARAEERLKEINAAYEDALAWDASLGEVEPEMWLDVPESPVYPLLFRRDSFVVRIVALVLLLVLSFFAVARTMNALDLISYRSRDELKGHR